MNSKYLNHNPDVLKAIHSWFLKIHEKPARRAELSRCEKLQDVFFCQAYWDLYYRICEAHGSGLSRKQQEQLAVLAGNLAFCRTWRSGEASMGKAFAAPGQDTAPLSALRFRRLLTQKTVADLFQPLRRALRVIRYQFPTPALIRSLLGWGDYTRKQWALDFYSTANDKN